MKLSTNKRAFSGTKNTDLPRLKPPETEKKRPGSGQPLPIVKSPLPPRKQMHSSSEKPRPQYISTSVKDTNKKLGESQDFEIHLARSQIPTPQQLQQHQHQTQQLKYNPQMLLPSVKSPVKAKKPPLQQERKIIVQNVKVQQPGLNVRVISTQKIVKTPNPKVQYQEQFHWNDVPQGEPLQQLNQRGLLKKRRQQSHDQQGTQNKIDFTMTTKKDDLTQMLAMYRQQLEEAINQSRSTNNPMLNMSEIQEQSEEGLSSMAQSTLYQQFKR